MSECDDDFGLPDSRRNTGSPTYAEIRSRVLAECKAKAQAMREEYWGDGLEEGAFTLDAVLALFSEGGPPRP